MRLPRVRFTVRRLMVVVAIVAVPMGFAAELGRRRSAYLSQERTTRSVAGRKAVACSRG